MLEDVCVYTIIKKLQRMLIFLALLVRQTEPLRLAEGKSWILKARSLKAKRLPRVGTYGVCTIRTNRYGDAHG